MIQELVGKTLTKIENFNGRELRFHTSDGEVYLMYHYQDCCENVYIEDIIGDLDDLVGSPIVLAEERTNSDDRIETTEYGVGLWTFYEFATNKGSVTIRWYGSSNGYYGVVVSFEKIDRNY